MVETPDKSFSFQGRMSQPQGSLNETSVKGTVFVALAIRYKTNPKVQLQIENDELIVYLDGEELDFAGLTEQRVDNVTIIKKGNETFIVRFNSGISLQVSSLNHILTNILVTVPEDFSTKGLLGQLNGDPEDDFLPRNAALPIPINSTMETIHQQFGLTCKIKNICSDTP